MQKHQRKYWTEVAKRRVAADQKFQCALCHKLLNALWAADHKVPLYQGGTNALSNCQILHVECHAKKSTDEQIRAADQRREVRTRTSKYWDPQSLSYSPPLPPHEFCERLKKRRTSSF